MNLIKIENFKRFSNIEIEINPIGLTLISGVNNSGKTSILHSLAVWEYAKILLTNYRTKASLLKNYDDKKKGLGITPESFSPINIPSLKYLWKNQNTNSSYNLKICVGWKSKDDKDLHLGIAFTLHGNNFAIKKYESNINNNDLIPKIAYLPPFGGMNENESFLSVADRRKLIGKGQAGSVIRNVILELHNAHEKKIAKEKKERYPLKKRLTTKDKDDLAYISTEWRILKRILASVFKVQLRVQKFDSNFHNYIIVDVMDLVYDKIKNEMTLDVASKRDLMVEGSGFLQWLSVFAMALDPNYNILLLDEPDAHLHSSLQVLLLNKLKDICKLNNKQILMVSHSPELIKSIYYDKILHVENDKAKYLTSADKKVCVLEGLGSKYFPLLDEIIQHKNILLTENDSDQRVLKYLCNALELTWPNNLVLWETNKKHKERKTLIIELNQKIMAQTGKPISAYSLRDLDDENHRVTNNKLHYNGLNEIKDDSGKYPILKYRTLRRREIENYLIITTAISRYIMTNCKDPDILKGVDAVNEYLCKEHGLVVPCNYKDSDIAHNTEALFIKDPKPILDGINNHFRVKFDKEEYIKSIKQDEISEDLKYVIREIITMCN
ncbi:ATP-dependent nuclease [Tenacibaculum finnmarkense]|uniref:ATP-dependent nuclease n=1 Tax=Tenacibaculum finnmarkense TaxID=2781243 RepID=UPI001E2FD865|nr:AAA family ATPase [Tenacibaculum finnmarkense]MCD8445644.1 AAA family ATPase [Tenacibaculum finnmarkense genomovar ulcerans]